ncbi:MAG: AAA family ATPase [Terracidiphilus sp.]|jgi:pilus assembly protein CpaE
MPGFIEVPGAPGAAVLSIALIGPDEERRKAVAGTLAGCHGVTIREFSSYPAGLHELFQILEQYFDVVIIELDGNPKLALEVVKYICDDDAATVMVYSAQANRELVVRCMHAGAREFLALPLAAADMADALARVTVRRPEASAPKRTAAKLFVFLGVKGGCGVTTVASNFAVSLAQESGRKTLLIDLGLPLGDVAIHLGIVANHSTENAFRDSSRLDASFLSSLLAKHSSGLSVLPAPGDLPQTQATMDTINKLLAVARQNFDYVVVDAGSRLDLKDSALFDPSATFYLIVQVGVSELRNANRIISRLFAAGDRELQIVLNRYAPHALSLDEEHITRALTKPCQWKIPNDFTTARHARNTDTPLALNNSPLSIAIRQMARKACGLPEIQEKKKGFSLFGRSR